MRYSRTIKHAVRVFYKVLKKLIILGVILYLAIVAYNIYKKTMRYQWYLLARYNVALIKFGVFGSVSKVTVVNLEGNKVLMNAKQFVHNPYLKLYLTKFFTTIGNVLLDSLKIVSCIITIMAMLLSQKNRLQHIKNNISRVLFLDPQKLRKVLKKAQKCSDLEVGGAPLVKNSEIKHILITGTSGSGKSVCMLELMDQVRRRKERAILYDDSGCFIQYYYRPEHDIILNPLDARCAAWNIWQEAKNLTDFTTIAISLMPLLLGNDPKLINAARMLFATVAEHLRISNNTTTRLLLQPLLSSDLQSLTTLLRGTIYEPLVTAANNEAVLAIKAILANYCQALNYLQDASNSKLFSIRTWLQQDHTDSWIFIASSGATIELLKPLISVWLDVAARGMLSLPPSFERRMWLVIDGLANLQHLDSLYLLLSRGRKYGVCAVTALQDITQVHAIYGKEAGQALLARYGTHVGFRSECLATAQWLSSLSYGNGIKKDRTSTKERCKKPLILDPEFLNLKDGEAYMLLPENMPVTKITLNVKKRILLADPVQPRTDLRLALDATFEPAPLETTVDRPILNEKPTNDKAEANKETKADF